MQILKDILELHIFGVFSTTLAFLVQTICQKRVDGIKTAIILSTEAVFGTLFSIILLHEVVTGRMIIGSMIRFTSDYNV